MTPSRSRPISASPTAPDGAGSIMTTCSRCGATDTSTDDDSVPPGWSFATDERGLRYTCEECTRLNVRAIEAKLPEEWWE